MAYDPPGFPRVSKIRVRLGALAANAAADAAVVTVPHDATVTAATITFDAAVTGATSTKRTITLENRGTDGSGTTNIGTLDFTTGTNAVKHVPLALTLNATAANLLASGGATFALKEAVTSTGTANPGGLLEITLTSR